MMAAVRLNGLADAALGRRAGAFGLWVALLCGVGALSACGGGGGGGTAPVVQPPVAVDPTPPVTTPPVTPPVTPPPVVVDPPPPVTPPPVANDGALTVATPGQVLAFAKAKVRERQAARASGGLPSENFIDTSNGGIELFNGTVLDPGIEEADIVKGDAARLYTLVRPARTLPSGVSGSGGPPAGTPGGQLQVHRRLADGSLALQGSLTVLVPEPDQSLFARGVVVEAAGGPRLAAIGEIRAVESRTCFGGPSCAFKTPLSRTEVAVDIVQASDPAAPRIEQRLRFDGRLLASHLSGGALLLVTQSQAPASQAEPREGTPAAAYDAAVDALTMADVLPTVRVDGGAARPLFEETDCRLQAKNVSQSLDITALTVIDLTATPVVRRTQCFVGGLEALYLSPSALYLATSRNVLRRPDGSNSFTVPARTSIDLHKFGFDRSGVAYRASGEVEGHLGWRRVDGRPNLGEWRGDLRVLTYTAGSGWGEELPATAKAPSPSRLTILREAPAGPAAGTLQVLSTLPNAQRPTRLGKAGEQVSYARLLGDRGWLAGYRRSDALQVLDLSNPLDPRVIGALEGAGFADQWHALGDGLWLVSGRNRFDDTSDAGVRLALFDLKEPSNMTQRGAVTVGISGNLSLWQERRGLAFLRRDGVMRVTVPTATVKGPFTDRALELQRLEVDTAARSLTARTALPSAPPRSFLDTENERGLPLGDQVHYFSAGTLRTVPW